MSPSPYSKLQRRHPLFLICADKKLILLFLRNLSTDMGRRQAETLAMRTFCGLFEIRHIIENMMNWHHSGFNLYGGKAIWPHNEEGLASGSQSLRLGEKI